jgi:mannosyltransferase
MQAALAIATVVILGQCLGAFVGLKTSSFWVDELYTAWAIDTPTWAEVWRRALADVHPPAHALAAHAWVSAFGLSEISLRLLSALASVAAVAILVFGARRHLSLGARLLVGTVAVSSAFWLEQSQNGRMYGLGMMFGALLAVIALHIAVTREPGRPTSLKTNLALIAVGFVTCFIHFYLFLAVGAIYLGLLLTASAWRDRIVLAAGGLLTASAMLVFVSLLLSNTMVDVHGTWFRNSIGLFVGGSWSGVASYLGKGAALLLAAALLAVAARATSYWKDEIARRRMVAAGVLLFVQIGLIAAGVTVSLAVAPSFSPRNISVAAPFTWVAIGCLFDIVSARLSPPLRATLLLICVLVSAVNGRGVFDRFLPQREEYRASAAFIHNIPACAGGAIPVVRRFYGGVSPQMIAVARYEYGYYLGRGLGQPLRNALPIGYVLAPGRFHFSPQITGLMQDRLSGRDACPVLAWVVHVSDVDDESLAHGVGEAGGVSDPAVRILSFPHYLPVSHMRVVEARVALVARAGASAAPH